MAKLYVTEYAECGPDQRSTETVFPKEPILADQVVSFSTTTQSSAFQDSTTIVRLHTDSICSVAFGVNPSATTSNRRMAAGQTEYFTVPRGQSFKVAAVTNT